MWTEAVSLPPLLLAVNLKCLFNNYMTQYQQISYDRWFHVVSWKGCGTKICGIFQGITTWIVWRELTIGYHWWWVPTFLRNILSPSLELLKVEAVCFSETLDTHLPVHMVSQFRRAPSTFLSSREPEVLY